MNSRNAIFSGLTQLLSIIICMMVSLDAKSFASADDLLLAVSNHCQSKPCACFANKSKDLQFTFGNGADSNPLLEFPIDFQFEMVSGKLKPLEQAQSEIRNFFEQMQLSRLQPFCRNFSLPGQGISGFVQISEYVILDHMFYLQLKNNGGFCNSFQKCDCQFSVGGSEMEPDFMNHFEIGVDGSQYNTYTGGSTGGAIFTDTPIYVDNVKAYLKKNPKEKLNFIKIQMDQIEKFRPVCNDFENVEKGGRRFFTKLLKL